MGEVLTRFLRRFIAAAALLVWFSPALLADALVVYTENYPPFSFAGADGAVDGIATAKVRQLLDEADVDYSFRLLPWARTMHFAQTQDNALIFSLTWTPKREPQFDWLAPLAESNFYLHARADDMRLFSPQTIKSGVYTGTCVANDLGCEFFLWAGMPPANIIPINKSITGDFQMVIAGRADLYISDVTVNTRLRLSHGHDPTLTKPVMKLEGKTGFYLAAGLQVPVAVRGKIKAAYATLQSRRSYKIIPAERLPD